MRSFATISVLGVFVTTVLAAPSVQKLQDGREVKLAIQQIKSTSESDIAVTDLKTSQLLGHACSTTLNSGAFANLPISADLDHMGAGKITLGSKTYQVHEDPEISGGVTCSRVYSDAQTYTACTVILPESLDLAPVSKTDGCFTKGASPVFENTIGLITTAQSTPLHPLENVTIANRGLEERQGACGTWSSYTAPVGNGNPHQNYYNTQLSVSIRPVLYNKGRRHVNEFRKISIATAQSAALAMNKANPLPSTGQPLQQWMSGLMEALVSSYPGRPGTSTVARPTLVTRSASGILRPTRRIQSRIITTTSALAHSLMAPPSYFRPTRTMLVDITTVSSIAVLIRAITTGTTAAQLEDPLEFGWVIARDKARFPCSLKSTFLHSH